jgi:PAS domain S-box-containing protein
MSQINFDLQASHCIISILEKSKINSEGLFKELPDFYLIIQGNGMVLKGNKVAASVFNSDSELLLGRQLRDLFKNESWNVFKTKIDAVLSGGDKTIDFELSLGTDPEREIIFYWNLKVLRKQNSKTPATISVIGRDITELRRHEKKLVEMFACMPIGIITLDKDGVIENPYSAYTEYLLGQTELVGKNLFSVLFNYCVGLSESEKEGLQNLLKFYRIQFSTYELIEDTFPKKVKFRYESDSKIIERHYGLTFQPIVFENEVRRLMVLIEDRTVLVQLEEDQNRRKVLEDKHIQRIVQLKTCDNEILPDIVSEIQGLIGLCRNLIQSKELQELANKLHGVKGNARLGEFKNLVDLAHALEKGVLNGSIIEADLIQNFEELEKEWREFVGLYNALFGSGTATQLNKKNPFLMFCKKIEKQVELTSCRLGKKVKVDFMGEAKDLPEEIFSELGEVCLHLVNNAIDHGIETPPERKARGKSEIGLIQIYLEPRENGIFVTLSDDGRGLVSEKIKQSALKKQMIGAKDELNEQQIFSLIFQPQFSTADQINEVSGRGIGLNAAKKLVEARQGWIKVESDSQKTGAKFSFFIANERSSILRRAA